jgi:hypothetical protein
MLVHVCAYHINLPQHGHDTKREAWFTHAQPLTKRASYVQTQ